MVTLCFDVPSIWSMNVVSPWQLTRSVLQPAACERRAVQLLEAQDFGWYFVDIMVWSPKKSTVNYCIYVLFMKHHSTYGHGHGSFWMNMSGKQSFMRMKHYHEIEMSFSPAKNNNPDTVPSVIRSIQDPPALQCNQTLSEEAGLGLLANNIQPHRDETFNTKM